MWEELGRGTNILNFIIDGLFFVDVIVIFFTAVVDENLEMNYHRSYIFRTYITSWFIIDIVAIIPFESFVAKNGEAANLVRYARIGRITKMLKLIKLLRLMKL